MKQDIQNGMKLVNTNLDYITINKDGMKINADVNVKNQLTKEYVMKNLFGALVIVNMNVINHVI